MASPMAIVAALLVVSSTDAAALQAENLAYVSPSLPRLVRKLDTLCGLHAGCAARDTRCIHNLADGDAGVS